MLNIVLLGPPGAGKGTQAKMIVKKYSIPHVSTGDIFRKHIAEKTPLGKEAKEYIDIGLLVPDELTVNIIRERLQQTDCSNSFLLDGFPRTLKQTEALDNFMANNNNKIDIALLIEVPRERILNRMIGRRVCRNCGSSYHIVYNPPKIEGVCDFCGNNIVQRKDDQEDTVKERLIVYDKQTQPLIDYYTNQGKLTLIDGTQDIDVVFNIICEVLGRLK